MERTGDREYREISEDITVHLSSIWLRCGMKYQGFVYDWDLLWELLLFSHQVVSTSFTTPRPIACHGILQARTLEWVAISFSKGLPDPGIELVSPAYQVDSLPLVPPGRRQWHPTPILLPGKSHGWRSLVGCSTWGHEESDMTKWLHFHFSLSCIGEGNGNPLQCSYLENPRDGSLVGCPSMGLHRVRYDWSDLAAAAPPGKPSLRQERSL